VDHDSGTGPTTYFTDTSSENSTRRHPPKLVFNLSSSASEIREPLVGGFYPEYDSGGAPGFSGLERALWPLPAPRTEPLSGSWTKTTSDINLVHHLLALYFSWEYPIFSPLAKDIFLRDFHNGRRRYCSPLLINAILALSCRLSTLPMTRGEPTNPASAGDHFFDEARQLLDQEADHHSMTTIQALGIMSTREFSCGRDQEGRYYAGQSMRLAIEMGLNRVSDDRDEDLLCVQLSTFWGAFSLDAWVQLV
jgi:hypothetical protein